MMSSCLSFLNAHDIYIYILSIWPTLHYTSSDFSLVQIEVESLTSLPSTLNWKLHSFLSFLLVLAQHWLRISVSNCEISVSTHIIFGWIIMFLCVPGKNWQLRAFEGSNRCSAQKTRWNSLFVFVPQNTIHRVKRYNFFLNNFWKWTE